MYAEIHSKDELKDSQSAGKRTYVNFPIEEKSIQVSREKQEHIGSPAWHIEIRDSGYYSDNRPEWYEIRRTALIQLTPADINELLKKLIKNNLITLHDLRACEG
jgi:hypothetical protein